MMWTRISRGIAAAALVLSSCAQPQGSPETTVTIGTFNIEWLGDGDQDRKQRADQDYLRLADIVIKSGADVLSIQEVENQDALNKVLRYLDGYQGFLSDGGNHQRVGVIYKADVQVTSLGDYNALQLDQPMRLRPGLAIVCSKGAFDWVQMIVHLKSTSRYDSTAALLDQARNIRREQAKVLRRWADSVLDAGEELDVVITGDLNDHPTKTRHETLGALSESDRLVFLTKDLTSCKNRKWSVIDHVVVSTQAAQRLIPGSARTENQYDYLSEAEADLVSDHCPVVVRFSSLGVDTDGR